MSSFTVLNIFKIFRDSGGISVQFSRLNVDTEAVIFMLSDSTALKTDRILECKSLHGLLSVSEDHCQ